MISALSHSYRSPLRYGKKPSCWTWVTWAASNEKHSLLIINFKNGHWFFQWTWYECPNAGDTSLNCRTWYGYFQTSPNLIRCGLVTQLVRRGISKTRRGRDTNTHIKVGPTSTTIREWDLIYRCMQQFWYELYSCGGNVLGVSCRKVRYAPYYKWHTPSMTLVASFTKEVNPRLAKRPMKTNGRLANLELTSSEKEATLASCKRKRD